MTDLNYVTLLSLLEAIRYDCSRHKDSEWPCYVCGAENSAEWPLSEWVTAELDRIAEALPECALWCLETASQPHLQRRELGSREGGIVTDRQTGESDPNSNDLAPMEGHMPTGCPQTDAVYEVCGSCGGSGQQYHPVMTRLLNEADATCWHSTAALAQAAEVSETHAVTLLHRLVDKGRMARRSRGGRGGGFEWRALP